MFASRFCVAFLFTEPNLGWIGVNTGQVLQRKTGPKAVIWSVGLHRF